MKNLAILIGRLGQDPIIRYTPSGDPIATFSLATSDTWKDAKTGERKEKTEWHNVVVFSKVAKAIGDYVKKGHLLGVTGCIRTRKYTDKQGIERYTTEIVVDSFNGDITFLERKDSGTRPPALTEPPEYMPRDAGSQTASAGGDFDDDIPF
jgi:single-strand DNA-binding protein